MAIRIKDAGQPGWREVSRSVAARWVDTWLQGGLDEARINSRLRGATAMEVAPREVKQYRKERESMAAKQMTFGDPMPSRKTPTKKKATSSKKAPSSKKTTSKGTVEVKVKPAKVTPRGRRPDQTQYVRSHFRRPRA